MSRSFGAVALALGIVLVGVVVVLALRGHPGSDPSRRQGARGLSRSTLATTVPTTGKPTSPAPTGSAPTTSVPAAPTTPAPPGGSPDPATVNQGTPGQTATDPSSGPPESAAGSAPGGQSGWGAGGAPSGAASRPAPARAPLTVLNNSRRPGLAERAAAQFAAGGWTIADIGNFTGRIAVTTVYYEPDEQDAARTLAAQFPAIKRVLPRFAGLPGSGLTVVVTREYPA
ncbi:MAG: LytR C-terminal domain-containing protein [Actinomycetota bacterium]|nr:LytR C-terminal domain-containing protein [Actinomycetota bacterium]